MPEWPKSNDVLGTVNRGNPAESGLCTLCRCDCAGKCETWMSCLKGRHMLYPRDFGYVTAGADNTTHVGVNYNALRIQGYNYGATGLASGKTTDPDNCLFTNVSLETSFGRSKPIRCRLPLMTGALGSTFIAAKYWESFATGCALVGIPIVVGENVVGVDRQSILKGGKITVSPEMDRRIEIYKRYYDGYGAKVSTVEALRGQSGWLGLSVLSVDALGMVEDYLLLAGVTDAGQTLHEEDAHKLLRLPAQVLEADLLMPPPAALDDDLKRLEREQLATVNARNLGYFDAEVQKLDAWADDLKVGLENEVKELDREIKDVRRTATVAATLEEKLQCQKRQRELEDKRNQLRRKIFDRQDEIDGQRNKLIEALESRLDRKMQTTAVFTIQWSLQ